MKLSLSGVFADAGAMWRDHRDVLGAMTGVFFVLPILGILFLMAQSGLPADPDPVKLNAAVQKFYGDNVVWFLLANLAIDFGSFAILMLFLQPGERTLGETLLLTLRRLGWFVAIDLVAAMLFGIGLSLFLLPGLFAFARTWLAAPAFVAVPEQGVLGAFRQGWKRSEGFAWLVLLGAGAATILVSIFVILFGSILLGLAGAMTGDNRILEAIGYILIAVIGSLAWVTLALLRVAAYRRTEPRQGI